MVSSDELAQNKMPHHFSYLYNKDINRGRGRFFKKLGYGAECSFPMYGNVSISLRNASKRRGKRCRVKSAKGGGGQC